MKRGTKKLVEVAVVWNCLHIFSINVIAHTSFSTSVSHFSHMCLSHTLLHVNVTDKSRILTTSSSCAGSWPN